MRSIVVTTSSLVVGAILQSSFLLLSSSTVIVAVEGFTPSSTTRISTTTTTTSLSFIRPLQQQQQQQQQQQRPYTTPTFETKTALYSTKTGTDTTETTTTTTGPLMISKLDGRKINGIIQPLNNFVLVRTVDAIEATEGGIFLTGKAKIKKTQGTVVAVGPGRTHQDSGIIVPMPVQPGDGVVYGKYDGTAIDLDGKAHTLIRDDDILVTYSGTKLTIDNVNVVHDNVLVYVDKNEQETEGGIIIAKLGGGGSGSSSSDKPSTGKVVKVGTGKMASNGTIMSMDVQINDMVKFRNYAGNEIEIDTIEYTVVRMVDILAKY